MRIFYLFISLYLFSTFLSGQEGKDLSYYLPAEASYDEKIPTPESVLGYKVGKWHVRHDQLVSYMKALAASSERVSITTYAHSYEDRPLLLLTITSPENQKNIEQIRQEHIALSDPEKSKDIEIKDMPLVVYMGYGVHGNEPSATNSTLLVAYHLAALQGEEINDWLNKTVVLLDPSINPDGNARFAAWVNSQKSKNLIASPYSREHIETWPRGRTNHYWFDLNRDWLLVQHPESQGRIQQFQRWRPNILTDYHEMGTNATYFFQPGIPTRTHPLTPKENYELTGKIAQFHAQALDDIGSLYYSRESFDDFYYGKGSTYPDAHGSIGILFEQASSRGHLQESDHGLLAFPFTIRNQVATSLSTFQAAQKHRLELLDYQRRFYTSALEDAQKDTVKAYVVSSGKDPARFFHFLELLHRHKIDVHHLAERLVLEGEVYAAENSCIVSLSQPQYRLIKALFEKRTSFVDNLFYDVSAWTMPLAHNLAYLELDEKVYRSSLLGEKMGEAKAPQGKLLGGEKPYAYLFEWYGYYAPRSLNRLLANDFIVKVATQPFICGTGKEQIKFSRGTILVPVGVQKKAKLAELKSIIEKITNEDGVDVHALRTGLNPQGIDLGSPNFTKVDSPKALILVGDGVNGYDAGEIWHLFDQRLNIDLVLVRARDLKWVDWSKHQTLILADGSYSIGDKDLQNIQGWVKNGGTIVAFKSAISWVANNGLAKIQWVEDEVVEGKAERRSYAKLAQDFGEQYIGGTIVQARLDLTHPLAYGYERDKMALFQRGTLFFHPSENVYATPIVYTEKPLLAGYISAKNEAKLKNSAAVVVCSVGAGRTICLGNNTNFRAFWLGSNKIFLNAVFFGPLIDSSATEVVD